MLTWALVWLCTTAGVTNMPRMFLLLAMAGDVASVFLSRAPAVGGRGVLTSRLRRMKLSDRKALARGSK